MKLVQLLSDVGKKRVCKSGYVRSSDTTLPSRLVAVVLHKNVTGETDSFHLAIYGTGRVVKFDLSLLLSGNCHLNTPLRYREVFDWDGAVVDRPAIRGKKEPNVCSACSSCSCWDGSI